MTDEERHRHATWPIGIAIGGANEKVKTANPGRAFPSRSFHSGDSQECCAGMVAAGVRDRTRSMTDFINSFSSKLIDSGLASQWSLKGCSKSEIQELEYRFDVRLPEQYVTLFA
jgi:hypothetical protein